MSQATLAGEVANDQPPSSAPQASDLTALKKKYDLPEIPNKNYFTDKDCVEDYKSTVALAARRPIKSIDITKIVETAKLKGVPEYSLRRALNFVTLNPEKVANQDWVAVFAVKQKSSAPRLFLVNTETGEVIARRSGVGQNSFGPDGIPSQFSNEDNTRKTSLGCMLTGQPFQLDGTKTKNRFNGNILRLHGLDKDSNDNNCFRAVWMHETNQTKFDGTSDGCISLDHADAKEVTDRLQSGAIICTDP
jgi:hypothetical protein